MRFRTSQGLQHNFFRSSSNTQRIIKLAVAKRVSRALIKKRIRINNLIVEYKFDRHNTQIDKINEFNNNN